MSNLKNPWRTERNCLFCGNNSSNCLIELKPHQFCDVNFAYRKDAVSVLGISPDTSFPIVQCENCNFVYSKYLLNAELLNKVYEEVIIPDKCFEYSTGLSRYQHCLNIWYKLLHALSANLDEGKTMRVLDYGAGWGTFLQIARGLGIEAVGLENSTCRLEYMIKSGINAVKTLEEARSFGKYDIICCDQVLEHVNDPEGVLRELHLMMKSNGVAFFSVPNYSKKKLKDQIKKANSGTPIPKELNPWEHLNYFTPESFYSMIIRMGFKPINYFQIEPYLYDRKVSNISFLRNIIRIELKLANFIFNQLFRKKGTGKTEVYARAKLNPEL